MKAMPSYFLLDCFHHPPVAMTTGASVRLASRSLVPSYMFREQTNRRVNCVGIGRIEKKKER